MFRLSRLPIVAIAIIAGLFSGLQTASARCQVISATHSALTKDGALESSQILAMQNALEIKQRNGWRFYTVRARRVTPDPFWKAVRPLVPAEAIVGRPIVTARTHTICWTGVVVPYVCTSGSLVCAH